MLPPNKESIVAAIVELANRSYRRSDIPLGITDATFKLYKIALSQPNSVKKEEDAQEIAKRIVSDAFHEFFMNFSIKDIAGTTKFNEAVLKEFEMIAYLSEIAISHGLRKDSSGSCKEVMKEYVNLRSHFPSPAGETFQSIETMHEFKMVFYHVIGKLHTFMRIVVKYSPSEVWFSDMFAVSIAGLLAYKFPWLPPSMSVLAPIYDRWLGDKKGTDIMLKTAWKLLTSNEPYEQPMFFPQMNFIPEFQLFPTEKWFKLIEFPRVEKPSFFPVNFEGFLEDAGLSIQKKTSPQISAELVPLPVGRVFVAYQSELLRAGKKFPLSDFETDFLKLKMLCKLSMSESNTFPLPSLLSTCLNIMGEHKMVKYSQDYKKDFQQSNIGTFFKRMVSFENHLQFVLDYHLIFWRVFMDKDTWNFQLPFFLFENLFMEIFAVATFHIKSLTNLVSLLNEIERSVFTRVSSQLPEDQLWLTEYIMQAIAIAASSLTTNISTFVSSLVSNEKMLHLYALMQGDKRCYFNKPCVRDNLFTYQDLVYMKYKGMVMRVSPHGFHSTSYFPTVAIPTITVFAFDIAIKSSVNFWFRFFLSQNLEQHNEGLSFVCDRIAQDVWFAHIAHRIVVEDSTLYRKSIKETIKLGLDLVMRSNDKPSLVEHVLNRIESILLGQVTRYKSWDSQFILREYLSLFVENLQAHTPMYEISQILIFTHQYLGVHLEEYKCYKKLDTLEWTKKFTGNPQAEISASFDLLAVPDSLQDVDANDSDRSGKRMNKVWANHLLVNALKELHSIQYGENFHDKLPLQFLEYLEPLLTGHKLLHVRDLMDKQELRASLVFIHEAVYPADRLKETLLPFTDWILSSKVNAESRYRMLVDHPFILKQTFPVVAKVAEALSKIGRSFKIPESQERMYVAQNRFQASLEELIRSNKCPHLIRFIFNEVQIDHKMKLFLLRKSSCSAQGTIPEEFFLFQDPSYTTSIPDFTQLKTPRPFSAVLNSKENLPRNQAVTSNFSPPEGAKTDSGIPKKSSSGLKAGFFKNSKASGSAASIPNRNDAEKDLLISITEELQDVINKFDDVSSLLTRDEPLSLTEIEHFENSIKNIARKFPQFTIDKVTPMSFQPDIYSSIIFNILTKPRDTPWYAKYLHPKHFENIFNGQNITKYLDWRTHVLNRSLDFFKNNQKEIHTILIGKLRSRSQRTIPFQRK
jgi:hypothetical protein